MEEPKGRGRGRAVSDFLFVGYKVHGELDERVSETLADHRSQRASRYREDIIITLISGEIVRVSGQPINCLKCYGTELYVIRLFINELPN